MEHNLDSSPRRGRTELRKTAVAAVRDAEGDAGQLDVVQADVTPPHVRDLTWDAMCEFADRVKRSGRAAELEVVALRRREGLINVVEGLWVGDKWTDVFEPVRRRLAFSDRWTVVQSVDAAASKIGAFLDDRPDLGNGSET